MKKFKLDKEKQEFIKTFFGEDFYNNLYWYQKWLIQTQIKYEHIKRFNMIKRYLENGKKENNSNTRNT